jgi:hypothetical protein
MKKILLFITVLALSVRSFAQQTDPPQLSVKETYLKKSKNQKTAAWVLLGGGVALIGAGFLIGDGKESSFDDAATGVIMGGIGTLSMIGSIPLFLASSKNKRRAMKATTSIKMERAFYAQGHTFMTTNYPALQIKISL